MGEFQAKFEENMLNTRLVKPLRQRGKKQGELLWLAMNETAGISVFYYAAQIKMPREYTATCACRTKLPLGPLPDRAGDETVGGGSWTPEGAPFESDEAAKEVATSPGFDHHIERAGGAGGRFKGASNAGRFPEALERWLMELRRHSVIGVSAHGKGIGGAIWSTLTGCL